MNLITFNGTTAQPVGITPFLGGKNAAIVNMSGASVTPQYTVDGTNWVALGSAVAATSMAAVTIPASALSVRLSAAGTAYLLATA
jgi:hypothetical protein